MDQKPEAKVRTRRIGSLLVGGLAILALAASPALAHTKVGTSDTVRHILLASEFVGADQDEASDLEGLLDAEDGNDQGDNVDEVDGSNNDGQADQTGDNQDGPDEVDNANNDDQTGDSETDSPDSPDSSGGDSGSSGGHDGSEHSGGGDD